MIYPPGTILQHMYFKERLSKITPGQFIEVGAGSGHISKILLEHQWNGVGFELNLQAVQTVEKNMANAINARHYALIHEDWLNTHFDKKADLIISSMVLEHLNEQDEIRYFQKCQSLLKPGGKLILFVPGCNDYWGIEDEIAGHYRRYTLTALHDLVQKLGWTIVHSAGLTYPISNILFPFSEFLVNRSENKKKLLSMQEKTELSGNRQVKFKTTFPKFMSCLLNEKIMYPFHILQKINSLHHKSMVIYVECDRS